MIDDLARAGRRIFRQNLAETLVETVHALGEPLALGIAIIVEIGVSLGRVVRAFGDDVVEPFPDRHARAARGLPGAVPHLGPHAFYVPRHAKFHALTRIRNGTRTARIRTGAGW